ncbi:hypothetical protein QUF75_05645 [Desulfococcaceae bacterium HSG7]|nr:hypothetical protein [Desulfococcaceae bacterium HSG7]
METRELTYLGNRAILKAPKTAFFCSRQCPADIVVKSYDWALEQRQKANCVISCFHSRIEKDVFQILLKGSQPIILVLARGMQKRWSAQIKTALAQNRILIISPFDESVKWINAQRADIRNRLMLDMADKISIAHARSGGSLEGLLSFYRDKEVMIGFE